MCIISNDHEVYLNFTILFTAYYKEKMTLPTVVAKMVLTPDRSENVDIFFSCLQSMKYADTCAKHNKYQMNQSTFCGIDCRLKRIT